MERQNAKEAFAKDRAACMASIPSRIGRYEQRQQCIADAMDRDLSPAFPDDQARIEYFGSQNVLLGQAVDQGRMTREEASARSAQLKMQVEEAHQQDAAVRQQEAAEQASANAQLLGASAALAQASRPVYVAPVYQPGFRQPVQTTCNQLGSFTNCTSQ